MSDCHEQIEAAVKEAFNVAQLRATAARDNLINSFRTKGEPEAEREGYEFAIDELDKIAFAMGTMRDLPEARDKSRFERKP